MNINQLKLCLLTHRQGKPLEEYQHTILRAINGGVTSLQLREKSASQEELYELALFFKKLLTPSQTPLIINDNLSLAKDIQADGLHLGQNDIHPDEARAILGPDACIGLSIETWEQLESANTLSSIDYIAASAVFPSESKNDLKTIWYLDGLQRIVNHSKHPVLAIGGININNIQQTMACGASGIAVIGAIHNHPNPMRAASDLLTAMR